MTTNGIYHPVDWERYQFYQPTEEEKNDNIIIKLHVILKGCRIKHPKAFVTITEIKFKSKVPNPEFIDDYYYADVIYPPDAFKFVDEEQISKVKNEIENVLYRCTYLDDNVGIGKHIKRPFNLMTSDWY